MLPAEVRPAAALCHSPDGYVRLRAGALHAIVLEHVCTVQDPGVLEDALADDRLATAGGITEWQGRVGTRLVTLGWDWLRLHDGALVPDRAVPPRTNLMPLDARGYDTAGDEQAAALWDLIAQLDWQQTAALAADEPPSYL